MSYYNRQGEPITLDKWINVLHGPHKNRVALTEIGVGQVSTVWLGLDHRLYGNGPPLIFETMVFGGVLDGSCERYSTEAEAFAGHDEWVAEVRAGGQT